MTRAATLAIVAALVATVVAAAGCRGHGRPSAAAAAPVPDPSPEAIVKEQDAGPAKLTLTVWPPKPTLGDSIWLRVEVDSDPGVTVDLPFEQTALGRFSVLRYVTDSDRTADGGTRRVDTYELGAPMSGRHRLPPFRVVIHDGRAGAGSDAGVAAGPIEVLTEEIPLDVGAVLADRTDRSLGEPAGKLPTRVGAVSWIPGAIAGAAALALVVGGVFGWRAWRARVVRRSQETAWEQAMRHLAELEARGAPDAATADAWFVELSMVVRRYVEERFRVRAPELTTEEFLQEARRLGALTGPHRELLGQFLEECDRVKFAGYRPDADESMAALRSARGFVDDTRPGDVGAPAQEVARAVVA
ncbi:MAG: DUF4381 family protein [Kofleriaceae bacterium]|nr:DUF4381 family protein [Kofleriaceae bacterium]